MKVLVLNSSYLPVGIVGWKRGIKLLFLKKADMLETSDRKIKSISNNFSIPSVIRLATYNNLPRTTYRYSRANIHKRDKYRCRYCNKLLKGESNYTIDHIIPKSRGGKDTWDNTVTCCIECNHKKQNLTPEEAGMKLLPGQIKPSYFINLASTNPGWKKYLPINS